MKKKVILSFLMSLIILSGCRGGTPSTSEDSNNTSSEQGKVTISYWNLLTGADGTMMRQLVRNFNEEYKGVIEVAEQSVNGDDYYNTLNMMIPIGRGPDVAIMHSYYVQSYANRDIIVPIDDLVSNSDIDLNDYVEDLVDSLYFNDKLYGIPLDIHPLGIYYNKDLLEQFNCEVPTSRSELIECAKKAPNKDGDIWGLPISAEWPTDYTFTSSLYQNGGQELIGLDEPGYETKEAEEALKAVTDLIHVHKLSPLELGNDQDLFYFKNNKALFHIQGIWMLNSIIESDVNFGVIPLSNMFNENSELIAVRSHSFVFPYQPKVSQAKREAALTFIKYIGDNSYLWATAGQIPASKVARDTDEYKELPYHSGFGKIENFRVAKASPYYHEAYTPIFSRLTYAMRNSNYDAEELLRLAAVEGKKLVKEAKENIG